MAQGEGWSAQEIAVTVADYMRMFMLELSGQAYSKTAHRRALLPLLDGRSPAAVELKHQNISAVLRERGHHWIVGYKPRGNYQLALASFVERWLADHPEFDRIALAAAEQPAIAPSTVDFERLMVAPPPSRPARTAAGPVAPHGRAERVAVRRDYVALEARNAALGDAGERLALAYEEFRLRAAGKKHLAERIDHVSASRGDGLGYDILSYELTGEERYIEVKTTAFAKETPFYASRNELDFAGEHASQFHLYRLFEFRRAPRLFALQGDIARHCRLDPVSYLCRF
ncbi:MAG: DUF3883 domain-containing protein [Candidatus Dactylopiibacterium sp.]|nr:DUF3883 domain-containing protein [Candidatus Dactylopiibacterium sp.]